MKIQLVSNNESFNNVGATVLINPEISDWDTLNNFNNLLFNNNKNQENRIMPDHLLQSLVSSTSLTDIHGGDSVNPFSTDQLEKYYNEQFVINNENQINDNFEESCIRRIPTDVDTKDTNKQNVRIFRRGIVNPNYPGFQHLAYTLKDLSQSGSLSFSENDMTDEDIDILTDSSCNEQLTDLTQEKENELNNNTEISPVIIKNLHNKEVHGNRNKENIPDLLKNISIDTYEKQCKEIDNNFATGDIIGDFSKEVHDGIKEFLNYNLYVDEDYIELRRDILNNFSKPIENTLNNISDVMDRVIKRLVETNDTHDSEEINPYCEDKKILTTNISSHKISSKMSKIQPSFLMLSRPEKHNIIDAFLSDGTDNFLNAEDNENGIYNNFKEEDVLSANNTISEIGISQETHKDKNCNIVQSETVVSTLEGFVSEQKKCTKPSRESTRKFCPEFQKTSANIKDAKKSVELQDTYNETDLGMFDVFNIETALPKLDFDTIETHLRAAKEAERRKRNDREEIRKRLAMGGDSEDFYSLGHIERPGKKPSLQSRLQSGKNLEICFMNEDASDYEQLGLDGDKNTNPKKTVLSKSSVFSKSNYTLSNQPYQGRPLSLAISTHQNTGLSGPPLHKSRISSSQSLGHIPIKESDFFALQSTLQTEARIALAQAKEIAHLQMQHEKRARATSPVREMLRSTMEKACVPMAPDRRRVSRLLLTDMNIAQLQVIVNELHTQIEVLNDVLVKLLMARDELHMVQDSMLVDIEDLTRYLGVKEQTKKTKGGGNNKSAIKKLSSLVRK